MDINKVSCLLCQRCEETEITGALSTKDKVTAHQNWLLFSSGLYCRNSPQSDDLFGFSVEDVLKEVKRGSKLKCSKCLTSGATAGCEVKRCKKSYHYPCAVKHRAKIVEDADQGKYGLYCSKHSQQTQGDSPTASRQSVCSSDSSSSVTHSSSKRRVTFGDGQEGTPSKRKSQEVIVTDDSSNSSYNEPDSEMIIFAPVETDFEESANSVPETQVIRNDNQSPTGSISGNHLEDGSIAGNKDGEETVITSVECDTLPSFESDCDSESLLTPVSQPPSVTMAVVSTQTASALLPSVVLFKAEVEASQRTDRGSSPDQSPVHSPAELATGPAGPPPSLHRSSPLYGTCSPAPPSDPEPSVDSASFWKSCNAARCTQALFTGFLDEMNDISSRIQSDRASREDYDHALTVMSASGKLAERVAKQQEELQRKQAELQKATAAMKEVVSALRT